MAEELIISKGLTKEEKYQSLLPQVKALIGNEPDMVANMANLSAALKQAFDFFWVGFYRVIDNELVLGPFQGQSLALASAWDEEYAGQHGKNKRLWSFPMWINFQDILLVMLLPDQK